MANTFSQGLGFLLLLTSALGVVCVVLITEQRVTHLSEPVQLSSTTRLEKEEGSRYKKLSGFTRGLTVGSENYYLTDLLWPPKSVFQHILLHCSSSSSEQLWIRLFLEAGFWEGCLTHFCRNVSLRYKMVGVTNTAIEPDSAFSSVMLASW